MIQYKTVDGLLQICNLCGIPSQTHAGILLNIQQFNITVPRVRKERVLVKGTILTL